MVDFCRSGHIFASYMIRVVHVPYDVICDTVGRINFEDKKFRGFRGYLLNLEIKYPRKFPA